MTAPRPGMPEVTAVDREAVRKEFFRVYLADTPKAKSVAFGPHLSSSRPAQKCWPSP